jgi:hypothetical protein
MVLDSLQPTCGIATSGQGIFGLESKNFRRIKQILELDVV